MVSILFKIPYTIYSVYSPLIHEQFHSLYTQKMKRCINVCGKILRSTKFSFATFLYIVYWCECYILWLNKIPIKQDSSSVVRPEVCLS